MIRRRLSKKGEACRRSPGPGIFICGVHSYANDDSLGELGIRWDDSSHNSQRFLISALHGIELKASGAVAVLSTAPCFFCRSMNSTLTPAEEAAFFRFEASPDLESILRLVDLGLLSVAVDGARHMTTEGGRLYLDLVCEREA